MALTTITGGIDTGFSTKLNNNFNFNLKTSILLPAQNAATMAQEVGYTIRANDYIAADAWTAVAGRNSTRTGGTADYDVSNACYVNTIADEASGDSLYEINTFTSTANAFDSDDNTYATRTTSGGAITEGMGKTFASARQVDAVRIKCSTTSTTEWIKLYSYNGASWNDESTLTTGNSYEGIVYLNKSVEGIAVYFRVTNSDSRLHTLEYGNFTTGDTTVITDSGLNLDGTETDILVYGGLTTETNTSVTVDISDGSTTLSSQALNSVINISSLSSGDLDLTFNLNTTNNTNYVLFYSYGVSILR